MKIRGLSVHDALIEGGRHRLRPILMTAFATMLALAPLAVTGGGGGVELSAGREPRGSLRRGGVRLRGGARAPPHHRGEDQLRRLLGGEVGFSGHLLLLPIWGMPRQIIDPRGRLTITRIR